MSAFKSFHLADSSIRGEQGVVQRDGMARDQELLSTRARTAFVSSMNNCLKANHAPEPPRCDPAR